MTGEEHYDEAERLLAVAQSTGAGAPTTAAQRDHAIWLAQTHAQLALAYAALETDIIARHRSEVYA